MIYSSTHTSIKQYVHASNRCKQPNQCNISPPRGSETCAENATLAHNQSHPVVIEDVQYKQGYFLWRYITQQA
jgi:hypothetical protein